MGFQLSMDTPSQIQVFLGQNISPLDSLLPVSIESGGAIFIQYNSPTIANWIIQNRSAIFRTGIYSEGNSIANIKFCNISGNLATFGGGI